MKVLIFYLSAYVMLVSLSHVSSLNSQAMVWYGFKIRAYYKSLPSLVELCGTPVWGHMVEVCQSTRALERCQDYQDEHHAVAHAVRGPHGTRAEGSTRCAGCWEGLC